MKSRLLSFISILISIVIVACFFIYKKIFLNPKRNLNDKDRVNIENLEKLVAQELEAFKEYLQRQKHKRIERKTAKFLKKTS